MRFERREHRSFALVIATPVLAILCALALAGLLIAIAGAPVMEAYWRILVGAFGSRLSATETLTRASPLILTGLAAAVAFRAKLWNIGAEGQFYLGAIAVAAASSHLFGGLPAPPGSAASRRRRGSRHRPAARAALAEAALFGRRGRYHASP